MTLQVSVYTEDETTGERVYFDLGTGGELAGFEVARHELWGADVMGELGLTILPTLKHTDIVADGEFLDELERDVRLILDNLELVNQRTNWREDYIAHRTTNILNAIKKAREVNGTVWIA